MVYVHHTLIFPGNNKVLCTTYKTFLENLHLTQKFKMADLGTTVF